MDVLSRRGSRAGGGLGSRVGEDDLSCRAVVKHIFQKNATKFETRILTRHETIRHDSVCDVMRFRKFTDTFDLNPLFFKILAIFCTNGDSGTARYSNCPDTNRRCAYILRKYLGK